MDRVERFQRRQTKTQQIIGEKAVEQVMEDKGNKTTTELTVEHLQLFEKLGFKAGFTLDATQNVVSALSLVKDIVAMIARPQQPVVIPEFDLDKHHGYQHLVRQSIDTRQEVNELRAELEKTNRLLQELTKENYPVKPVESVQETITITVDRNDDEPEQSPQRKHERKFEWIALDDNTIGINNYILHDIPFKQRGEAIAVDWNRTEDPRVLVNSIVKQLASQGFEDVANGNRLTAAGFQFVISKHNALVRNDDDRQTWSEYVKSILG